MSCKRCNDQGIILVAVEGWNNPLWDNDHARSGYPSYADCDYHPLVMDCKCKYHNPITNDQVFEVVSNWLDTYHFS